MPLEGTVVNGNIVLDGDEKLPDGVRVEVAIKSGVSKVGQEQPSLTSLLEFVGALDDLPPDFAAEHDHYIHGTPRRSENCS